MATLAARYIFKLVANFITVPVYILMEAILPRALGPSIYGNFNFATNLFQQLTGFLDMGTSTCLANLIARKQNHPAIFSFYLRLILAVFLLLLLCNILLFFPEAASYITPDVPTFFIPLAALWAWLTWVGRVLRSVNDALGITIASEIWRASISILSAFLLVCLFLTQYLNITTLFLQQYVCLGLSCLAFWHVCLAHWKEKGLKLSWRISARRKKICISRFFNYSHPLFVQALLSFFMLTTERWLLQWFDGSVQQGFFALSQKVGMACFLFVSAMTPLLMREFSIAWGEKNTMLMGELLTRFASFLYGLAAYFSCFTLIESKTIVEIFGGAEFSAAILPVQIMALYPIHQAYGQIASSVFHSSGKTRILRNLTACECIYGLSLAWLFLAPNSFGGFNLGATGLALKTVITQVITVNLYLWLISRFLPFNLKRNLFHQFWCIIAFIFLAYCCRELTLFCIPQNIIRFFACGLLYSGLVLLSIWLCPQILGLSSKDVQELLTRFNKKNILKRKSTR